MNTLEWVLTILLAIGFILTALYAKYGKPLIDGREEIIDELMNENAELHEYLDGWCKEWCDPEKTGHAIWCPKSKRGKP